MHRRSHVTGFRHYNITYSLLLSISTTSLPTYIHICANFSRFILVLITRNSSADNIAKVKFLRRHRTRRKRRHLHLYSALHGIQTTLKCSGMHHSFTCNKRTPYLPYTS